jgi:uncharacterized protein with PIN domain
VSISRLSLWLRICNLITEVVADCDHQTVMAGATTTAILLIRSRPTALLRKSKRSIRPILVAQIYQSQADK